MSREYFRTIFRKSLWCLNYKLNFQPRISQYRVFHMGKGLYASEKYTIKLRPDIEKLLDDGEMKHRKHPGIRQLVPIDIPEKLKAAAYRLISEESEKELLDKAKDMFASLVNRRLPIEAHEIEHRIKTLFPSFEGSVKDLSSLLNKQQLGAIKKRLISELYRWKPIEYNRNECLVYLFMRLAPNYASTFYVLNELKTIMPDFKPTTYFDFGSGVGSSLWAANTLFSDSINEYYCVDASADMNELCGNLITDEISEDRHIQPVYFRQFLPASEMRKFDLIVSAFSLLDISSAEERLRTIDTLWRKTKDFLVIIEYGNAAGFHCVLDARDFILKVENDSSPEFEYYSSEAYVVSPCPHDSPCPKFLEKTNSSCGFSIFYNLTFPQRRSHILMKDWISYVILRKGQRPNDFSPSPRIVKPVLKRVRHVHCDLCCSDGKLHNIVVTKGKQGRNTYRCVKECRQGDSLPIDLEIVQPNEDGS